MAFAWAVIAMLVAAGAIAFAVVNEKFWAPMLVFLAAVGVVIVLQQRSMKTMLALVRRDMDRQRFEPEIRTTTIPYEIRRTAGIGLPATLSAIFFVALSASVIFIDLVFAVMISILALPILGVVWGVAWRRSGQWVATLTARSLVLPQTEIPWTNVARIDLVRVPRSEVRNLALQLIDPLPPRGWMDRINSSLSRGAADREISVRLHHVRDDPQMLLEIAEELQRKATDAGRVDVARAAQLSVARAAQFAEAVAATRRFRDLPKVERWRQIKLVCWIFAILLFTVHGAAADFYASDAWWRASGWIAAAVTGLGLWLLLRGPGLASLRRGGGTISYLTMFVIVFALLSGISWCIVGRSLPDLATRAFGEPREMTLQLFKDHKRSSRKCRRVAGANISDSSELRYCASPAEYAALPESGPMRLRTHASWFGIHVDWIEPADSLWNR